MSVREMHKAWVEQCDAAERIKLRYGCKAAFDYLVGEKLLNFARAAADNADFARALPQFVSRARLIFSSEEMQTEIARLEQEMHDSALVEPEDDALIGADPASLAQQAERFAAIKDLLTARHLGIS